MPVRIALHAHIFYPDLWPELANCIRNFPSDATDVFLTYPDTLPTSVGEDLLREFPNATVCRLENRGYDIGPFVTILSGLNFDDYDFVVKIHTKRSRRAIVKFLPYWGSKWRRKLLAILCYAGVCSQNTYRVRKTSRHRYGRTRRPYHASKRRTYSRLCREISHER